MRLRGSITVFVSIILSVLIAFSGIIVDLARLKTGRKHAQAAVQLSLQSALTRYHAPLKEQYGIMATGQNLEELEMLIHDLLEKNLAAENRYTPGLVDLYGFEIEDIKVTPFFNMTEDYVLEQQITQFMKYRAPVNAIENFIEKLKALNTCMAQSGLLNKKMDLEKKLQEIREEQVYLSLIFSERINGFSPEGKINKEISKKLALINELVKDVKKKEETGSKLDKAYNSIPDLLKKIAEVKSLVSGVENEISIHEEKMNSYKKEYDNLEKEIKACQNKINNLNKKLKELEKSSEVLKTTEEIVAVKNELTAYENLYNSQNKELSDISGKITGLEKTIAENKSTIADYESRIKTESAQLEKEVNICLAVSGEIKENIECIYQNVQELGALIKKHISYNTQSLSLTDEIEKSCKSVSELSEDINAEISRQTEKSDNAFLMRIRADIKKLVLSADQSVLADIREKTEYNLSALKDIEKAVENAEEEAGSMLAYISDFIEDTKKIPESCGAPAKENVGAVFENISSSIEAQIAEKTKDYKKILYSIEPQINQKEKNEFLRWCNRVFTEDNEVDNSKDKGYQKKLKQNIEKSDKENKENKTDYNGEDKDLSDKELNDIFEGLPSFRDRNGHYVNVKESGQIPEQLEDNDILPEKVDTESDIEKKYDNTLSRNGNFAQKVGQILSGSFEALINSMYVNEFIVGAFKNANIDTVSVPGIRPGGFTDETFYEKAEVEYIIFGTKREKTNANLAQTSIFGIRMGLNLVHVYTSSEKAAAALTAATAIAGWTGFGVPIVKNLIQIGWAAGESWLDVKDINAGRAVPIYKTKHTWKLDLKSLFSDIAGQFLDETSGWLKKTKDEMIDKGDDALQNVVNEMVASAVHEAFLPLEQAVTELGDELDKAGEPLFQNIRDMGELNDFEALKEWIIEAAQKQFQSALEEGENWTKNKLEDYKRKITEKILNFIFESSAYKNLVGKLKDGLDNIIDSGMEQLSGGIEKLGVGIKDSGIKDQLVGTVVSFDYTDYLRLLLFLVPQKTKLLRTGDLITLNMRKTLDNPDFFLLDYNSFILVEAEISIRYLFLPALSGDSEKGRIKIRWGYGY